MRRRPYTSPSERRRREQTVTIIRFWAVVLGIVIIAAGMVGLWFVPVGDKLHVGLCIYSQIVGGVAVLVGCAPRHLT